MPVCCPASSASCRWTMSRLCSSRQRGLSLTSPPEHLGTPSRCVLDWKCRGTAGLMTAARALKVWLGPKYGTGDASWFKILIFFFLRWWSTAPFRPSSACWPRRCCTSASRLCGLSGTLQVILLNSAASSYSLHSLTLLPTPPPHPDLNHMEIMLAGDGPVYRDVLIECNVVPALLARISPDTPVSCALHNNTSSSH